MKAKIVGILMVAILMAAAGLPIGNTLDVEEHGDRELSYTLDQTKPNRPQSTPLLPPFLLRWVNGDWNYWSNTPHIYTIPEGNVGIGTDTPTDDLHVKGDLNYQAIFESTDAAGGIGLRADTGQAYGLLAVPSDHTGLENYFVIHDVIADQTRLSIDKTGNIIINTPGAGLTFPDGTTQTTAGGGGDGGDNDWAWASGSGLTGGIYHTGNVGIGTNTPGAKLDVNGDIDVSGNRIKDYYGFPRPDYDSGWVAFDKWEKIELHHDLGGNPMDYVIDMIYKGGGKGIHNFMHGGGHWGDQPVGAYWMNLTWDTITVLRYKGPADYIRIRIWVYE